MEYYPDLTLAENYLLNYMLILDEHGLTANREMLLRNFFSVSEEEINQILNSLEEKKYIEIKHKTNSAWFLEGLSKGRNKTNETFDVSVNFKKVYEKYRNKKRRGKND